jgi:Response regulators consisting of a CheY-like receiver domain and a winged-helix DNA-binding domain
VFADSSVGEHAVRTADTGSEVFEALDTTVDVVLLDRRLPGISGSYTLVEMQQWLDPMVATISAVERRGGSLAGHRGVSGRPFPARFLGNLWQNRSTASNST